eukprot:UN04464
MFKILRKRENPEDLDPREAAKRTLQMSYSNCVHDAREVVNDHSSGQEWSFDFFSWLTAPRNRLRPKRLKQQAVANPQFCRLQLQIIRALHLPIRKQSKVCRPLVEVSFMDHSCCCYPVDCKGSSVSWDR